MHDKVIHLATIGGQLLAAAAGTPTGRPVKGTQRHFIREWRKARGLNIPQLAAKTGLTGSLISQIEVGRSRYSQKSLETIAAALDCEPWQLLGIDPTSDSWELFITARPNEGIEALDERDKAALSKTISSQIKYMLDEFAKGRFDKK
jgi:transcriptional regulator with XRE-family HTH domain